jgi:sugar phosphate isomerase/epimerase
MLGEAKYARTLGCRDIIIHPVPSGDTQNDAFRIGTLTESARRLAEIGRQSDVRFLIENMPPPVFGADAAMLRRIVDEVDSPHLGLSYDSGHAMLAGNPVGTIHAMGPRLWGVHLHDTRGTEDDHLIPGMGVVPFDDVARALAAVGYQGTFMIEVYRPTAEVRRDLTPERLAFIDRLRLLASGA